MMTQLPPTAILAVQVFVWEKSPVFVPVIVMLVMVNAAVPVLLKVMGVPAVAVPRETVPKATDGGARVTPGAAPVPVKVADWGLPEALSVMVTEALRAPLAVGVNVTLMEQLAPAATLAPQVLVCAKSPLLVPVMAMLVMLIAIVPVLESVIA